MLAVVLLAVVLVAGLAAACGRPEAEGPPTYVFSGPTMGTTFTVKVVAGRELDPGEQQAALAAVEEVLAGVDARMSTYRDDSELSRFNRHHATTPFAVSADTFTVFAAAQAISRETGGAFDVTVGPLVDAWGFGPHTKDAPPAEPDPAALAALRAEVGHNKLELDPDALTLRKQVPELACDLSAIAPGFAVDQVAAALEAHGLVDYMVEIGGEVRARGENAQGQAWRIGIERPHRERGGVQRIVPLVDRALVTSGDYRNYREVRGVRFSHIIDPRAGRPIRHRLASVTVLDPSCMSADALATALVVLGPEEGFRFAVDRDLEALFLVRNDNGSFSEQATPGFAALERQAATGRAGL